MTSRRGVRLVALLAPVAFFVPAGAHAASVTIEDGAGDAKAVNMAVALGELLDGSTQEGPYFLDAPAETSADVVSTTIEHARKRLTLSVRLRDLVDVTGHSAEFRIFTPEGRYSLASRVVDGRTVVDFYPPFRGDGVVVSEEGTVTVGPAPKPCRTVRARYESSADTLTASVPTSCLGSPKWVKVAAGVSRTTLTPLTDGSATIAGYVDDAFRSGVSVRSLGRSPKVRRG